MFLFDKNTAVPFGRMNVTETGTVISLLRYNFIKKSPCPFITLCSCGSLRPRTHGNVFGRFCIVSSNELVVLDSLENSKQYKNAGKRFRVYGA